MAKLKNKKFVPKLWASWNDLTDHQQKKMLDQDKKRLKTWKPTLQVQTKITNQKNMVKLVLDNKLTNYILKSHVCINYQKYCGKIFQKHEVTFTGKFLMIQNRLIFMIIQHLSFFVTPIRYIYSMCTQCMTLVMNLLWL